MRKALFVVASLVLLASSAAAITIESPSLSTYTQSQYRSLIVSDASGSVSYSVNGGANQSCECSVDSPATISPQGSVILTFYDVDDGTVNTASTEFFVDTEPPAVTEKRPIGTLFEKETELRIAYSDISQVDTDQVSVRRDGEPVNGTVSQDAFNTTVDLSEGTHTFSYNIPDEHWQSGGDHNATGSWNVTLPVEPRISDTGPVGTIDSSATLSLTARDPSRIALDSSYIAVSGPESVRINLDERTGAVSETEHGVNVSAALDSLPDGEYTVTAHIEDVKGNAAEQAWSFTVDTTPPDLAITSHVEGDVVAGSEQVSINVSDLTTVEEVNVSVGNQSVDATADGGAYTASVDTSPLADGEAVLTVRASDVRGNTASERVTITVDNHAPTITGLDVYPETAQGGIVISATARDTATQIIGARFRIEGPGDETVTDGRMNAVNGAYNRQQEAVRRVVDLDQFDLEDGDYTVFLMTRDAAGHDFEGFGTDFTLDSTLNASLDIQDTVFRQEIGTTTTFTVPVSNTGEVAEQVSFTAETSADTSIDPATRRIGTGETKQFELAVTLPNSTSALGNHSVTLTADGLSTADTVTTEIIGQPHPPRQQEIQADFQALVDRLAELNQSRQTWNVSSDAAEQYEDTAGRVSTVRQLLSEGRYTAAAAELAAAEQELEQTQSTISGEITRARLGAVASTAAKLLAVIAVAGLVYGGYRLIPEEEGYHPDSGYVHRPGGKHPLRLQIEGWWRRLQARRVESSEDRREKTVDRWEGYGS